MAAERRSTAANRNAIKPRDSVAAQSSPRLIWVAVRSRGRRAASSLAVMPDAKMQKLASSGGLSNPAWMRVYRWEGMNCSPYTPTSPFGTRA